MIHATIAATSSPKCRPHRPSDVGRPLYTAFQLEVFREGVTAGLTIRRAAHHAGINTSYARELSRRHRMKWARERPGYPDACRRLCATMAALAAQPLVHRLVHLAAERRLFVDL